MLTSYTIDPTKSITIRKAFSREAKRRINKSVGLLTKFLKEPNFGFLGDLSDLRTRLVMQDVNTVLNGNLTGRWQEPFIKRGYEHGIRRALQQSPRRKEFITDNFVSMVQERYKRYWDMTIDRSEQDLVLAVSEIASQFQKQILRLSKDELVRKGPKLIREIGLDVFKRKIKPLANYEIVANVADGQLDGFETLGLDKVRILVELKIGSNNPCKVCQELEGTVRTIEQARGIIPVHRNCMCGWVLVS